MHASPMWTSPPIHGYHWAWCCRHETRSDNIKDLGVSLVLYEILSRTRLLFCLQTSIPYVCGSRFIGTTPSSEISTLQFATSPQLRRTFHFIGSLRGNLSLTFMQTPPTIPPLGRSFFWATLMLAPETYRYLFMTVTRMRFVSES
jgi:hypothetical protein